MKLLFGLAKAAAVALCLVQSVQGFAANFTKRTVTSSNLINDFRGAVLILAGVQTSCEIALFNTQFGATAASCFIFKSDGSVDNNKDFKIAINSPTDGTSKMFTLDSIDVHSNYNPSTYANNIAFITFNTKNSQSWYAFVGANPAEWNSVLYSHRKMTSVKEKTWGSTSAAFLSSNSECSANSNLFSSNSNTMLCVTSAVTSPMNSNCRLPYGTGWGVMQPDDLSVSAIYSHSVITGDSLCQTTGTSYHYYTMIYPYIAWAKKKLDIDIDTFWLDDSFSPNSDKSFSMKNAAGASKSGIKLVSGDFYPMQRNYVPTAVSTPTPTPTPTRTPTPTKSSTKAAPVTVTTKATSAAPAPVVASTTSTTKAAAATTTKAEATVKAPAPVVASTTSTTKAAAATTTKAEATVKAPAPVVESTTPTTKAAAATTTKAEATKTTAPSNGGSNSGGNTGDSNDNDNNNSNNNDNSNHNHKNNNNNNNSNNNSGNGSSGGSTSGSKNSSVGSNNSSKSVGSANSSSHQTTRNPSANDEGSNDSEEVIEDDYEQIIEDGDLVTVNGSIIPIAELLTNPGMSDLEITRVLYLTKTDSNGELVLVSNIEVETYAYADYMDNDDDDIIEGPVDKIVPD
ncbi:hypothetical protein LPJ66_011027, partial [Kickxella alabastrina]